VLIFPEGTRIRPGALGKPKRGVGRLALETGATVIPVAMRGTERIRKGILIRPHKIRVRIGAPLTFPKMETATGPLAAAVTDRIWPNVMLQWEWLGGLPPLRRAAIVGSSETAVKLAAGLAQAGIEVDLLAELEARTQIELPAKVKPVTELQTARHDLVVFALPATELPAAVAEHGPRIEQRTGVLVLSRGLVPPLGALPGSYVADHVKTWASGVLVGGEDKLVLATRDDAFARQVGDALRAARLKTTRTKDVTRAELAACAEDAAALAFATAGPDAAGKVLEELGAYARQAGFKLAAEPPPPAASPDGASIALLATRMQQAGLEASAVRDLAKVA
jgi:hypothetical protein